MSNCQQLDIWLSATSLGLFIFYVAITRIAYRKEFHSKPKENNDEE